MRPKKRRHPNYKAYLAYQLRIMPEKFPFLSSQQIKAKILTTWESFSPEKKNDWATTGNSSQGSDGTEVSLYHKSPQHHRKRNHAPKISPSTRSTTKFMNISLPKSSMRNSTSCKSIKEKAQSTQPISEFQEISLPKALVKNPDSPNGSFKQVRFQKHALVCVVSSVENSESSLPGLDASPITDEFDCIENHNLVVEQERESHTSEDEKISSENRNVWPAIFGHTTSIWEELKTKNYTEEKKQLMCGLFEEAKPGRHIFDRRFLASLKPSDVKANRDIFDEDCSDNDIFA